MLTQAVDSYLALRRTSGFALRSEGTLLRSFAAFSAGRTARRLHGLYYGGGKNYCLRRHCPTWDTVKRQGRTFLNCRPIQKSVNFSVLLKTLAVLVYEF